MAVVVAIVVVRVVVPEYACCMTGTRERYFVQCGVVECMKLDGCLPVCGG